MTQANGGKGAAGQPKRRHGGRVLLNVSVLPHVRDRIRQRAAGFGVSMAQYVDHATDEKPPVYATDEARLAKPISNIGRHLRALEAALESGNVPAAKAALKDARNVVHETLLSFAKPHDEKTRTAGDSGEKHTGT